MTICGLVITLSQDPGQRELALEALGTANDITLGDGVGQRLPAVLEHDGGRADYRKRWEELEAMPGVPHLDLTYINYEHQEEQDHERRHP